MTDQQYEAIVAQMPDGMGGFMKSWGLRQFAEKVLAAAPQAHAAPVADEREAFEAFMRKDTSGFSLNREGESYEEFEVATYWHFWKARAALAVAHEAAPTAPAAPVVDERYKQALGSSNCMQCSVAYMLGLELDQVPDFASAGSAQQGWELFTSFISEYGYSAVMIPGNHSFEADYLVSGTSPRGVPHMVVMNDGRLLHDPHPSNAGLSEVQCVWLLALQAAPAAPAADATPWIDAKQQVPAKADGEVFVRFSDGSIGTAWATYWHGASTDFAEWSHPDPDEDRLVAYWMKPVPLAAKGDAP